MQNALSSLLWSRTVSIRLENRSKVSMLRKWSSRYQTPMIISTSYHYSKWRRSTKRKPSFGLKSTGTIKLNDGFIYSDTFREDFEERNPSQSTVGVTSHYQTHLNATNVDLKSI